MDAGSGTRSRRGLPLFVATLLLVGAGVVFLGVNAGSSSNAVTRLECTGDLWVEQSFMRSAEKASSRRSTTSVVHDVVEKRFTVYEDISPENGTFVVRSKGRIIGVVRIDDSFVEGIEACADHYIAS